MYFLYKIEKIFQQERQILILRYERFKKKKFIELNYKIAIKAKKALFFN